MGNNAISKVLPAIDMLLVLVVVLFSTAGLMRSLNGMTPDPNDPNAALAEEIEKQKELLRGLEQQLRTLQQCDDSVPELEAYRRKIVQQKDHIAQAEEGLNEVVTEVHTISLQHRIQQMTARSERLEKERQQLEQALRDLEADRVASHQLQRELEALEAEIRRIQAEIEKKGGRVWPGGSGYNGPYVLLECDDKGVVIYPGAERVPLDAPDEEMEALKERIGKKGAVLLLARPSSFKKSFDHFRPMLSRFVREKRQSGKNIVLTYWPIAEKASIEKYIPQGD